VTRVFLDANVLFSAAYRKDAGLARLWRLKGVELATSEYAAAEANMNLDTDEQRTRLAKLLTGVECVPEVADAPGLPDDVSLPDKDTPILQAAIRAGAEYLLTGDVRRFGPYLGKTIKGVTILRPADYLGRRRKKRRSTRLN